jgi:hypothetical protein
MTEPQPPVQLDRPDSLQGELAYTQSRLRAAEDALSIQRARAERAEQRLNALADAARNALDSLDMFIRDTSDPGAQALGDRYVLAQALATIAPQVGTEIAR